MKRLLLTTIALACLTGTAIAQRTTMPAEYVGYWCDGGDKGWRLCREQDEHDMVVERRGYAYPDGTCNVAAVKPERNGHRIEFFCCDDGLDFVKPKRNGNRLVFLCDDRDPVIKPKREVSHWRRKGKFLVQDR